MSFRGGSRKSGGGGGGGLRFCFQMRGGGGGGGGGAKILFSKAWGLGAALRPPEGPGHHPGWGLGGRSPRKLLNFNDLRNNI